MDYSHLKKIFTNDIYEVSLILKWDYLKLKKNHEIDSRDELKEFKKSEIQSYFKDYNFEDYIQLFDDISYLLTVEPNHSYGFQNSLEIMFLQLIDDDIDLLLSILEHIIVTKNELDFNPYQVIDALVNNSKYEVIDIYKLLVQGEYKLKSIWLQNFFYCLKEDAINDFFYSELIDMYKKWENNFYVRFEFWQKFKKFDTNIFISVFNILLSKTKTSEFNFDFHYWTLFEKYIKEFETDYNCLKELYLYKLQIEHHFDHGNKYLNCLIKIDNDLLFDVIKLMYSKADYVSERYENHSFDFIWEYENYEFLLEQSFEIVKEKYSLVDNIINVFFPATINEKVIDFIRNYIIKYHNDSERLENIFNVITHTYSSQRIYFLSILLEHIKDLEIIKSLELVKNFKSGGSLIPFYEADRKFWKEFEELLSHNVKYLKLKLWTKQEQMDCEGSIERNRKRDFIGDLSCPEIGLQ